LGVILHQVREGAQKAFMARTCSFRIVLPLMESLFWTPREYLDF